MAFGVKFSCSNCQWRISASGLNGYYENDAGEKGYIQHPCEHSDPNFQKYGIQGFAHDFICLHCGRKYTVYLPFPFGPRHDDCYGGPEEASIKEAKGTKKLCDCGNELAYFRNLKDRISAGEKIPCPNCHSGYLLCGKGWIT